MAAVAKAAEGKFFDIYLVNEPTNQYDKNAVAVFVGNQHVGYIGKPDNKQWFKRVNEATAEKELLWGRAKAVSREGTANTGIFGSIYMPKVGKGLDDLIAQKMTDASLSKAIEKVVTLSNASADPDTVAQLRSLCKKATTVATPLAAHSKWVEENPEGQDIDKWAQVMSACEEIFSNASEAAYATDDLGIDPIGSIEELANSVLELKQEG